MRWSGTNPAKLQVLLAKKNALVHLWVMALTTRERLPAWELARKSGTALFTWRRAVGLNRETFALLANFSERTLATYEKCAELPPTIRPQVTEAMRLIKALLEIIPADELAEWLQTPNSGFRGQKPQALIVKGERDMIWAMIHQTREASFG
jgi:hypothetical protein